MVATGLPDLVKARLVHDLAGRQGWLLAGHNDNAMRALFWLFFDAFNLLTLFLCRHPKSYGRDRGKDSTRTVSRRIDEMLDDLARLACEMWSPSAA